MNSYHSSFTSFLLNLSVLSFFLDEFGYRFINFFLSFQKHKYWFHWSFLFAVFALFYFLIFSKKKKKNESWFHFSFPLFGFFCSILFISTLIFIMSFLLLLWYLDSVCSSLSSFFSYKDRLFIWDFCYCCFLR